MKRYIYKGGGKIGECFEVDDNYIPPLSCTKSIFEGDKSKFAAAILYTKVVRDKGHTDDLKKYDNGLVGYQCIDYFDSLKEAKEKLPTYEALTPKVGVVDYIDIWLANNNKK